MLREKFDNVKFTLDGHFNGTHYEIVFKWGTLLAKHGNFILNNIGFPITPERVAFSETCIPIYEEYFPEILEEIQGIADGQNCDVKTLQAFLFSIMPCRRHVTAPARSISL